MKALFSRIRGSVALRRVLPALLAVSTALATPLVAATTALAAPKPPPAPKSVAPKPVSGIKSIALFGSSNEAGADGAGAAADLDPSLKERFNASGVYQVTSFSTLLPSVQRALYVDNTLTSADVQTPISDPAQALRVARVLDTDGYILDEVDSYRTDAATGRVSVTVSGNLYYTSNGASARTFAVTGSALPVAPDESAAEVTQRAVNSAAAQITTIVGAASATEGHSSGSLSAGEYQKRRVIGGVILAALAVAFYFIIAHNAGSHANHGTTTPNSSSTSAGSTSTTVSTGTSTTGPPAPPSYVSR